jgi:hypothetical protein
MQEHGETWLTLNSESDKAKIADHMALVADTVNVILQERLQDLRTMRLKPMSQVQETVYEENMRIIGAEIDKMEMIAERWS